ncbi:MAG: ribose-5-phosphate isomerase RpiA [Acidobacteriia bacterium]|nr:ribose-5-phosphate isomerase RpiA [Terriglobia bacterium]
MANEREKEAAGRAAAKLVRDGDIVGLGTGSTAYFAVVALGERVKSGLKMVGIPTSIATADLARQLGIPLTTLDEHPEIDITIDGADEIDPKLNLIKGGGGALLREKVVASVTKKMVVVSDSTKIVPALGKFPLPVEIIPFARTVIEKRIASLGATTKLRTKLDGQPFVTDNGNQILDCSFGRIADPPALARELSETVGVVEHGLFIGFAKLALVGTGSTVRQVRRKQLPISRRGSRPRLSGRARPANRRPERVQPKVSRPKPERQKRRQS